MDRQGADFFKCCKQVKEMLGSHRFTITIQYGAEDDFKGVVDLINFKELLGMKKIKE